MIFFKNLKTSQKITYSFLVFQSIFLLLLVLTLNVSYFFIWYFDLKKESLYDVNMNYESYSSMKNISNKEAFKNYILQKDTIIYSKKTGEMQCSEWITEKLHGDESKIEEIRKSTFYDIEGKTYIVFNKNYEEIWEVSVLYDTTEYIKSQIIIIKISIIFIIFYLIIGYFFWNKLLKYLLKNLKNISKIASEKKLGSKVSFPKYGKNDDEIQVLANTLEQSFQKIESQAQIQKQFLTDVAHEFKTPLMALNSKFDVFEKSIILGKTLDNRELILYWKKQITKLNSLLETLMLLSKLENNEKINKNTNIDLEDVIKNLEEEFENIFPLKSVNYEIKIEKNALLKADKVLFSIVLKNLVENSIKFSKESVKIQISYQKNILKITDNGVGISKENLKNIWDKFQRIDTKKEWFGIGLFLVKRICELHNWEISVESEPEKGTSFTIKTK